MIIISALKDETYVLYSRNQLYAILLEIAISLFIIYLVFKKYLFISTYCIVFIWLLLDLHLCHWDNSIAHFFKIF